MYTQQTKPKENRQGIFGAKEEQGQLRDYGNTKILLKQKVPIRTKTKI